MGKSQCNATHAAAETEMRDTVSAIPTYVKGDSVMWKMGILWCIDTHLRGCWKFSQTSRVSCDSRAGDLAKLSIHKVFTALQSHLAVTWHILIVCALAE